MVQSFNWPAICASFRVALQPQKLVPKLTFHDLSLIDWKLLKQQHGIKAVCLDKDNTITAPYQLHAHAIISKSLEECKREFGDQVAVYSNSCGAADFDPNFRVAEKFERLNGIKVIRHNNKKPNGADCILKHFGDGIAPGEIAFIGDRLLTDVLMANEAGMFSVLLTSPLTIQGDNAPAIIIRYLEQKLLSFIDRRK